MYKKLTVILIIFIIGAGFFYVFQKSNPQEVAYIRVEQTDYYETILATGTVVLEGLTDIKTEVSGKIVNLFVSEGDEIAKEQALLEFETTDVFLDLQQAEANYTLAKVCNEPGQLKVSFFP